MELYLVRHTTPDIPPGVCYGHAELDLHEDAAIEIIAVRDKLAAVRPAAFYTSPLLRCRRLAEALPWDTLQEDARLMEMHFGEWEMQLWDAIPREVFDYWAQHFVEHAPPGGESFRDLHRRASAFFADCADKHAGQTVVAVTHAGVIRSLLAHALRLALEHVPGFHLDFGGVTRIDVSGSQTRVVYVNR
jgi:alpha-ribazole phosphatase